MILKFCLINLTVMHTKHWNFYFKKIKKQINKNSFTKISNLINSIQMCILIIKALKMKIFKFLKIFFHNKKTKRCNYKRTLLCFRHLYFYNYLLSIKSLSIKSFDNIVLHFITLFFFFYFFLQYIKRKRGNSRRYKSVKKNTNID